MEKTGKKKQNIAERMDRLEERMDEIYNVILDLKTSMNKTFALEEQKRLGLRVEPSIARETISEIITTPHRLPNPWAIDTARALMDSRFFRHMINESYRTYEPTIRALRSKSDWLSADEVSEITGRKRNTESTYLNRLFKAHLLEQKKQGKKVLYNLKEKNLEKVFGRR